MTINDNKVPPTYDPSADRRDEFPQLDLPPRTALEEMQYRAWKTKRKPAGIEGE